MNIWTFISDPIFIQLSIKHVLHLKRQSNVLNLVYINDYCQPFDNCSVRSLHRHTSIWLPAITAAKKMAKFVVSVPM